jgi:hypothetical protein
VVVCGDLIGCQGILSNSRLDCNTFLSRLRAIGLRVAYSQMLPFAPEENLPKVCIVDFLRQTHRCRRCSG